MSWPVILSGVVCVTMLALGLNLLLPSTNLHERVNPDWRLVNAAPPVVHCSMGFRVTRAVATALWRAMWQNGNNRY